MYDFSFPCDLRVVVPETKDQGAERHAERCVHCRGLRCRVAMYCEGISNVARYGISKAPSSANISAAFLGSLIEEAAYSSMSSFGFFMDILRFLSICE